MLSLQSSIIFLYNSNLELSTDFTIPGNENGIEVDIPNVNANLTNIENLYDIINPNTPTNAFDDVQDIAIIFNWVNDIEIDTSLKNLTKTATITFPRNINFGGLNIEKGPSAIFSIGMRVIINLGYNETGLQEVFRGYIRKIGLTTPLVIECEDQMYALKQLRVLYPATPAEAQKKITLTNLLKRILTSQNNLNGASFYPYQFVSDGTVQPNTATFQNSPNIVPVIVLATNPGQSDTDAFTYTTINEKSAAEVFADLKKKTGIYSWFDDFGNLHFELPYIDSQLITNITPLTFEAQIIDDKSLKYQNADEVKIKVVYESKSSNKSIPPVYASGTTSSIPQGGANYIGDFNGDTITVHAAPDQTQAQCQKFATQILQNQKYTGYKGTFTTFGAPVLHVGAGVNLTSTKFPEKGGQYQIVGVKRKFGMSGYRQIVELGIQIGNQPS